MNLFFEIDQKINLLKDDEIIIFQTSKNNIKTQSYFINEIKNFEINSNNGWQKIIIDSYETFGMNFLGFGGAFTDSCGIIYNKLNDINKNLLIESYFSKSKGLKYEFGKVPIGSIDFSCRYNKDNKNNNKDKSCSFESSQYEYEKIELKEINYNYDNSEEQLKITMIQKSLEYNKNLNLICSSWSAPKIMKSNGVLVKGSLNKIDYDIYCKYLIDFLNFYKNNGINFFGISFQNEPIKRIIGQNWQTMYFTKKEYKDFLNIFNSYLLNWNKNNLEYSTKLVLYDDQTDNLLNWTKYFLNNNEDVTKNTIAIAFHWYLNRFFGYDKISKTSEYLKNIDGGNINLISSEACEGYLPLQNGVKINNLGRGLSYGKDILECLKRGVNSWIDWNLFLNEKGGPNWINRYVDAPIIVNSINGKIHYQPTYFIIAHFSLFIEKNSKLVQINSKGPFPLETVCFKTPKNKIVFIVLNRDITGRKYFIYDKLREKYINLTINSRSIQTIVYNFIKK